MAFLMTISALKKEALAACGERLKGIGFQKYKGGVIYSLDHFNAHRPHHALNQASPLRPLPDPIDTDIKVSRRDRLGGLIHEYAQVA
jgi:hypothetical protein